MASSDRKAVSQFPYPPRRYIHNCATDRPMPPPTPPSTGNYHIFGREYRLDDDPATMAAANAARLRGPNVPKPPQLFDSLKPPTVELRRLNTQLIELFLQLVDMLCTAPTVPADHGPHEALTKRIETVFTNMQQLINLMRPAQAAMDLKALLDRQTSTRKGMTVKLKEAHSKAWDLVSDAADNLSTPSVQLSDACVAAPLDSLTNHDDIKTGNGDLKGSQLLQQAGQKSLKDSKAKAEQKLLKRGSKSSADNDVDMADVADLTGFESDANNTSNRCSQAPSDQLLAQLAQLARDPSL